VNRSTRSCAAAALLAGALCAAPAHAAAAERAPCRILNLTASDRYLPAFVALDQAMLDVIRSRAPCPVELYAETLDMLRYPQEHLELEVVALMRKKYGHVRIDVVLATETAALDFAERYASELWPDAAIVFHSVQLSALRSRTLGPRTIGVPVRYDVGATLELALRLRPETRRVVVVAGTTPFDRDMVGLARKALEGLAPTLQVDYLVDLSLRDMLAAVAKLPPDAIVLYLTMFGDGAGAPQVPREVLRRVAEASPVPVFGFFETYVGHGIAAGAIASLATQGRRAGELAVRVLEGEQPAQLGVQAPVVPRCIADWRQLRRWGIDERLLPAECELQFKELGAWDRYRWQIFAALAIIVAQSALIATLWVQRRRRQRAELAVQQQLVELAHAGRLAVMGELTAAIAHEVNQPLGAILANVDAADMLLDSGTARLDDVRQILADVRKDDLRATEVIRRLRTLLAKHKPAHEPLDLNETTAEVARLLQAEARQRGVELVTELDRAAPTAMGDRVQIQQVLLNLIVNAMDAMAGTPAALRRVVVRTSRSAEGSVEIAVSDRGHGIPADHLPKLFQPYFTTKQRGMGLGLSIARSIIEAHDGRIWAESDGEQGATFRFTLPARGDRPA